MTIFMVELLPGIWLSNSKTLSERFVKQKKIKEMLDCDKDMTFFDETQNYIVAIRNQIKKDQHIKLQSYLLKATDVIHQTILNANTLVIYDPNITKKGIVLIIAYLLRYGHLKPEQTIRAISSKCKIPININEDYQLGLKILYKKLESLESSST
jgi:hypothetical protein